MSQNFLSEREGQIKFFDNLKISADVELTHNTDGVYKGTLFEFKLVVPNINRVLFQAIKYLSHRRIKGEPVPAQILLVALNEEIAYLFRSEDFLDDIEKIYAGAASKNNADFASQTAPEKIDFSRIDGLQRIIDVLNNHQYTRVHIDVFDVVGWANHYYRLNPQATKSHLFDELRAPDLFKAYIYPWQGQDIDFKYINDLLNAKNLKKELGAFYTPAPYCLKATELVRRAIKQLPAGHDYIILDRSAGTGNLEEFLTDRPVADITVGELENYIDKDLKSRYLRDKADVISTFYSDRNLHELTVGELEKYQTNLSLNDYLSDNEIGHAIVNTYELKEWIVLTERLGDKVRLIIPPRANPADALVNGGDALSDHFVLGSGAGKMFVDADYQAIIDELNGYVDNPKVNIILFENPPYRDGSGEEGYKNSYVRGQMKQQKLGIVANDIANQFIWSGWQYYLRKPDDFFVVFSPIKYWKIYKLADKKFIDGFLFNRQHFHASPSGISCILWQNQAYTNDTITLKAFDLSAATETAEVEVNYVKDIPMTKVYKAFSEFTPSKWQADDEIGLLGDRNGYEIPGETKAGKYNPNMVAYMTVNGFRISPLAMNLTTIAYRTDFIKNVGYYLRTDNFIDKLPLFAAKLFPQRQWFERDIYFTTADGGDSYLSDSEFLKNCLIFTGLSLRNHCRSFAGSDGRVYKNQLCFANGTLASQKLKAFELTADEQELLNIYGDILKKAASTKNFDSKCSYGPFQIDQELNTRQKNDNDEWVYDYPELNTDINTLKSKLAKYYQQVIRPKLFEYQLLK